MEPGDRHPLYPEFFARGTSGVFALRDAEGRPFGEMNAPEASRADVSFDVRECPYPHSRKGKEMNISALRQITQSWETILASVARIRSEYAVHFGGQPDVWWLWRFGVCASALPGFVVARGQSSTSLSGAIAGMFKAVQGMYMTTALAVERGLRPLDAPMTAQEFVDLTEQHGVFVGPTGGACAGPPHMIRAFVETAINGGDTSGTDELANLVGSFPQLFDYGRAIACQVLLWQILDASCERALRQLIDRCAGGTTPAARYAQKFLAARLQNMFGHGDPARLDGWIARSKARFTEESGHTIGDHKTTAAQVSALAALVRQGDSPIAADPRILEPWVETFINYVLLERELLVWFNDQQRRIDDATQQARKPDIDPSHVALAFYKNLRTLLRAPLGVTISVAGERVTATVGGRSVPI